MQGSGIVLEACVDSAESATRAAGHGAHRLELCKELHLEGTTPDRALIEAVLNAVSIPVKVMVRPRGGDFVYTDAEFEQMQQTIAWLKTTEVAEIATGVLRRDNTLDIERMEILADVAVPMQITVHKCIDLVPDIRRTIDQLKDISGITHILSSGQAATAWGGRVLLKQMAEWCQPKIQLIVAGKVTRDNLAALIDTTGAKEYHGRRIVQDPSG